MPALPVIADTYRVTLKWGAFRGIKPRNVLNIRQPSGSETLVGDSFAAGLATMASYSHLFHCLLDGFVCGELDILALDGTTAGISYLLPTALTGGAGSGECSPATSAVVSLKTGVRGPRGRGRVFAGPVAEARMADGILDSTSRTLMAAAWSSFRSGMNGATVPAKLVVASYVHADQHQVTGSSVRTVLGTQRRRQDQLR